LAREIVPVQFRDEHLTVFIPADGGRGCDERFAGDDFYPKPIRQLERRGALFGSQRLGRIRGFGNLPEGNMRAEKEDPKTHCGFEDRPD
jgi:hypothetical protein